MSLQYHWHRQRGQHQFQGNLRLFLTFIRQYHMGYRLLQEAHSFDLAFYQQLDGSQILRSLHFILIFELSQQLRIEHGQQPYHSLGQSRLLCC